MKACTLFALAFLAAGTPCLGCTQVLGDFSVAADLCADRSDCSQCQDYATCTSCEGEKHPEGAQIYAALFECLYCTACTFACDGAAMGCSQPWNRDACDVGTGAAACFDDTTSPATGCVPCAWESTCAPSVSDCMASADCAALITALVECPSN